MTQEDVVQSIEKAIEALKAYQKQRDETPELENDGARQPLKFAIDEFVLIASRVIPPPVGTSLGTPIICPRCSKTINVILS